MSKDPIDEVRSALARTQAEALAADKTAGNILDAARTRLSHIEANLPAAQRLGNHDSAGLQQFQNLLAERARMERMLALKS